MKYYLFIDGNIKRIFLASMCERDISEDSFKGEFNSHHEAKRFNQCRTQK
jgi:hypothetical protein